MDSFIPSRLITLAFCCSFYLTLSSPTITNSFVPFSTLTYQRKLICGLSLSRLRTGSNLLMSIWPCRDGKRIPRPTYSGNKGAQYILFMNDANDTSPRITSSNSTPSLLIYMIPYLTSPFINLWLLIHAPNLFCDVTFPLTLPFLSGCLRTLQEPDVLFTFDFPIPFPFDLCPDFNLLSNQTFTFNFPEVYILNSSFIQDIPFVTANLFRIQMYNSNVILAYDSHPYRHTPKFPLDG
jgi:hypothetical protein